MKSFTVLYYKSKKKKHKSKGESKFDGRLTVEAPPKSVVSLLHDDGSVVFRSIQSDIAQRELQVDEIIQLGGNEVEILSRDDDGINGGAVARNAMTTASSQSAGGLRSTTSNVPTTTNGMKKGSSSLRRPTTTTNSLLGKKRGLGATLTTKMTGKRVPPRQPVTKRVPPPQPKSSALHAAAAASTTGCSDQDEVEEENTVNTSRKTFGNISSSSLLTKQKKPFRPVPRQRHQQRPVGGIGLETTTSSSTHTNSNNQASDTIFNGAVGRLSVPNSIKSVLKEHQVEGLVFLWNNLTGKNQSANNISPHCTADSTEHFQGCILADEMGLGKTLQTIAVITALHRRKRDMRFVVVTPSSLVNNWGDEFDKWLGKASQPKRVIVKKGGEEGLQQIKAFCAFKPNLSEVLVISYDLFRMNISYLKAAKALELLVVDEGHRLKNTDGSKTMTALEALPVESRLCITATPIQNNLQDLYTLVNFVCPGLLGDLKTFRRDYERPIAACGEKGCTPDQKRKGSDQSRMLDRIVKTIMLRRLQKDTLKKILPPRHDYLLFVRPTQLQCRKYLEITRQQGLSSTSRAGAPTEALTALVALRKVCAHPLLLKASGEQQSNSSKHTAAVDVSQSGKLMVLGSLLREIRENAPDDKVVIVSNFTSTLTLIEESILKKASNFPSLRLDGKVDSKNRQNIVDTFNRVPTDMTFALLLSSKSGGVGLNLVGANRIILVDADWNPASDIQAMGRVYRQGQKKPSFIYRLFTSGTVEEIICQRQIQKGGLVTMTVDGDNECDSSKSKSTQSTQNKFSAEEIRDCFTLKEGCDSDTKRKVGSKWHDYNGKDDLVQQGCVDPALLEVASKDPSKNTLAYVHVVTEADVDIKDGSGEDEVMVEDEKNRVDEYDDNDEEEFEFDE